ncbi:hypothetical protein T4B_14267 [Trichinella pseudospiralis]|uniref:Uncharacterized protein n=1 Tax=Trichinella pseudospiralis TaxID=6337 RepID=A0A0V1IHU1_TRIPS|nr:hypothetical protein T4B_14267 [Trichinella pseudospiralis]
MDNVSPIINDTATLVLQFINDMKNAEMKLRLLAKENIKLDEALNFLEMYLEIHGCNSRDTILRIRPLCYATAVETKGLNPLLWGSILQENSSSNAQGASRVTVANDHERNPDSAQIFTILSIIVELSEKSAEQVEADEAQNSEVGKEAGQKVRDRTRQKKFCVKSEAAKEPMARYDDITVHFLILGNFHGKERKNAFDAYPVGEIYNFVPVADRKAMGIE